jgi:hypothetical protein
MEGSNLLGLALGARAAPGSVNLGFGLQTQSLLFAAFLAFSRWPSSTAASAFALDDRRPRRRNYLFSDAIRFLLVDVTRPINGKFCLKGPRAQQLQNCLIADISLQSKQRMKRCLLHGALIRALAHRRGTITCFSDALSRRNHCWS